MKKDDAGSEAETSTATREESDPDKPAG